MTRHPTQPIEPDEQGKLRFKKNAIVDYLVEHGRKTGCGLNELACMPFDPEDRRQLAQLIGYSIGGYSELSYVDDYSMDVIAKLASACGKTETEIRIESLEEQLATLRKQLRGPMANLFGIHPDDLRNNG